VQPKACCTILQRYRTVSRIASGVRVTWLQKLRKIAPIPLVSPARFEACSPVYSSVFLLPRISAPTWAYCLTKATIPQWQMYTSWRREALMLKTRHMMHMSDQFQASVALPPRKEVPIHYWIGSWVGPRVRLDAFEKDLFPYRESAHDCWVIHPVA